MKKGVVFMNAGGAFLQYFEVSSHGAGKVYDYHWVGCIDSATVSTGTLPTKGWKGKNPESEVRVAVMVEETKKVRVLQQ